jgi:hypothetical protein
LPAVVELLLAKVEVRAMVDPDEQTAEGVKAPLNRSTSGRDIVGGVIARAAGFDRVPIHRLTEAPAFLDEHRGGADGLRACA